MWVGAQSGSYGANRLRSLDPSSQLTVAGPAAVADVPSQGLQHTGLERAGQGQVERQLEGASPAGEVVVQLPPGWVQGAGPAQDPRADRPPELVQHGLLRWLVAHVPGCDQRSGLGTGEQD